MRPQLSLKEDDSYGKFKDSFEQATKRLNKAKEKEILGQNEKMFNRLLHILKNEKRSLSKNRNDKIGPSSLNIAVRRRQISQINQSNAIISKKLNNSKCIVPTVKDLKLHSTKTEKLIKFASHRKNDGSPKPDPLIKL